MPVFSTVGSMTYVKGGERYYQLPNIAEPIFCGFYAGLSSETSTTYTLLIVSNRFDGAATGFANYSTANTNCNNLVSGGCSDWTLPTFNQLSIMCQTKTQFAAIGQGYNTTPNTSSSVYWSRTGTGIPGFRRTILFWNCLQNDAAEYDFVSYRAVRTEVVQKY
jgi:hypothetical protein